MLNNKHAIIDIVFIMFFSLFFYFLSSKIDLFERFYLLTQTMERYELDEVLSVLVLLPAFLAFFSIRRLRESRIEVIKRKKAEQQLQQSLKEKEVLVKEVHHRVKNNLQIIASLLKLQEVNASDTKTLLLLKDSQSRIHAMGLVHKKLYSAPDLAHINIYDYFLSLTNNLHSVFGCSCCTITIESVAKVDVEIDQALTLGLILTELISNAFKHAFHSTKGIIEVSYHISSEGDRIFSISDNGCGLPKDFSIAKNSSLGLSLVQNLVVSKLLGLLSFAGNGGTTWEIIF